MVNIKKEVNAMQVCLHKIGACLLGNFTRCIDNAVIILQNWSEFVLFNTKLIAKKV